MPTMDIGNTYRDANDELVKIIAQLEPVYDCAAIFVGQYVGSNSVATYEHNGESISGLAPLVSHVVPGEAKWQSLTAREQHAITDIARELASRKITVVRIVRTLINSSLTEAKNIIEDINGNYHGGFTDNKKDIF